MPEFEDTGASVVAFETENEQKTKTKEAVKTETNSQQNQNAEPSGKVSEELEAYKKHFSALQEELAGIEEKYKGSSVSGDPNVEKRFSALENGMKEIKELLQKTQQVPPQPIPQTVQYVPQYQTPITPVANPYFTPSPVISTPAPVIPPIIQPNFGR